MTDWLARARHEIQDSPRGGTANTAIRTLTAVTAVPPPGGDGISLASNGSNGSTPAWESLEIKGGADGQGAVPLFAEVEPWPLAADLKANKAEILAALAEQKRPHAASPQAMCAWYYRTPDWDPATGRGAGTYLTPTEDLGGAMRELEERSLVIALLRRHGLSPSPGDSAGSSLPAMPDIADHPAMADIADHWDAAYRRSIESAPGYDPAAQARYCCQCANRATDKRCLAWERIGAPEGWKPADKAPRRCRGFVPQAPK